MLDDKKVSEDIKAEIRSLLPKVRCLCWCGSWITEMSRGCGLC